MRNNNQRIKEKFQLAAPMEMHHRQTIPLAYIVNIFLEACLRSEEVRGL